MSLKQSIIKQKRLENAIKFVMGHISEDCGINLSEYPNWSIYSYANLYNDDFIDGSWNYNCFENAAIYKRIKEHLQV